MPNQIFSKKNNVVTRFAPSPTGNLHCGAYRTAIFAYLYARKNKGTFVVRIEDTDKERSRKEYEDNIIESLSWLGLEYDVFIRQSENVLRHKEILEKLIVDGYAYISKEEAKDDSGVIKEIVRFKNPNIDVSFEDEIKGTVTMHTADLGDFVIAKNINEPLFHLAVVVDDFDADITHIIRGEDHVSNTPRQILIQRAIGAPTPMYAHLPLVLGDDKQKLSKRKGALAVTEYRDQGYLSPALLNMVTMVGWNPGTEQEIFSKQDLIEVFDLSKVQKSPAIFNEEKLNWYNKFYLNKLSFEEQKKYVTRFVDKKLSETPFFGSIVPIVLERVSNGAEIREAATNGEYSYYIEDPIYDPNKLIWKQSTKDETKIHLQYVFDQLQKINKSNFTQAVFKDMIWEYATEKGKGNVLWPIRYALTGADRSPDPLILVGVLGYDSTVARVKKALDLLV